MNRLLYLLCLQFFAVSALAQSVVREGRDDFRKPVSTMVQSLYSQVISRHPLGIPSGENRGIFEPYLSKKLIHALNLARSCQADWTQQTNGQTVKEPFAWGETGLFSGDEELSEPSSFQIERIDSKQDGSFRAYVQLSESAPNEEPWSWVVAVEVLTENKRFVIDDVVYLKGREVHTEKRLSEILKDGCDGPNWLGSAKQ